MTTSGLTRRQLLRILGALPLASVAACAAGSGTADPPQDGARALGSPEAPVSEAVVVSPDLSFDITTIYVQAGRPFRLTYRNEDSGVPHNWHVTGAGVDSKTPLRPGPDVQELTVTFPAPGEFGYVCDAHPNMVGVVIAV